MDRLPGLDLLRAVAIVWVMLFHSFIVGGLGPDFAWLSRYGWAGVDIFFVLSGYLIGSQVLRRLASPGPYSVADFYARRAWRILPAYAVVLAIYVAAPALREAPGLQAGWQFAIFTVNLLIDYDRNPAFSHAWSLCVEEHFYLVFPLAAWCLGRRLNATRFMLICAAIVALGALARGATWVHDTAIDPPRNWYIEDLYDPTWMRLDGLLTGVVLAALKVHRPALWDRLQRHAHAGVGLGLGLCAGAFWLFRDRTGLPANTVGWPLLSIGFGCLVFAAAGRHALIGRWRLPAAGWLATISYSLYLSHKIAFHIVQAYLLPSTRLPGGLVFAVYACVTLGVGALLHYLVERPGLRWRDRRMNPGAAAAPAPCVVASDPVSLTAHAAPGAAAD